ncbi:MAG: hypothetical protein AABW48_03420 [Nanoarchaeota archaeon]
MKEKMKLLEPIEPMLAVYAGGENVYEDILNRHGQLTFAELKYDGYRLQLHKKGSTVKGYTRNLNDVPLDIYPELSSSLSNLPNCILDCELNGGIGHTGFKTVKNRFRSKKTDLTAYEKKADLSKPVELRVFDVLYYGKKWLMELPLLERRNYTERIEESKIRPGQQWRVNSAETLEALFETLIESKHEGLVCKDPSSLYLPGDKSGKWTKIKKFETLDLVVLGVYLNNEEISQILCGAYNEESKCFETLAKINAKREGTNQVLADLLTGKFQAEIPASVIIHPKAKSEDLPQLYVEPRVSVVVEIKAMNLNYGKNEYSCGFDGNKSYSLRIAWAKQIREDKKPSQATTTTTVAELYKIQEGL